MPTRQKKPDVLKLNIPARLRPNLKKPVSTTSSFPVKQSMLRRILKWGVTLGIPLAMLGVGVKYYSSRLARANPSVNKGNSYDIGYQPYMHTADAKQTRDYAIERLIEEHRPNLADRSIPEVKLKIWEQLSSFEIYWNSFKRIASSFENATLGPIKIELAIYDLVRSENLSDNAKLSVLRKIVETTRLQIRFLQDLQRSRANNLSEFNNNISAIRDFDARLGDFAKKLNRFAAEISLLRSIASSSNYNEQRHFSLVLKRMFETAGLSALEVWFKSNVFDFETQKYFFTFFESNPEASLMIDYIRRYPNQFAQVRAIYEQNGFPFAESDLMMIRFFGEHLNLFEQVLSEYLFAQYPLNGIIMQRISGVPGNLQRNRFSVMRFFSDAYTRGKIRNDLTTLQAVLSAVNEVPNRFMTAEELQEFYGRYISMPTH